ncbi:multicopper oxidase domain-containing protein [Oscillatoria sp. FACHB-1406]|uniref:multicopper oxidase domain-containing protein n=1 Tax=Oscillatoria sp. FACHB-1406 TaxID=2692846 RepID=UPI001684AF93|nr:multicopper oxidase domain-containing protein [Oscillatoria sp. FACHB-1406]MBD2576802.1 multicopper oxidase domain-containing protein [Oscillatoria sp. FACHB-1406]
MSNSLLPKISGRSRRQFLEWGLTGVGAIGGAIALRSFLSDRTAPRVPEIVVPSPTETPNGFSPTAIAREFDYGVLKREGGKIIREFRLTARTTPLQLNSAVSFVSWNVNGRVPGPTLRATAGDRVRIIFHNEAGHSHSLHFHGTHPPEADGVMPIRNGKETIYEFTAEPFGVHLYHCHIAPIARHISKGLYGMFIVDPPQARPPADEIVLVMGGYDLNNDKRNELYAFNGLPDYYRSHPLKIYQNQLVRLYLLNMVEFDAALSFHIHGNLFRVYRTGRSLIPAEETDVITMGTAERHILEFSYPYAGRYMFHPHQDEIAERGCMGLFDVLPA